MLLAFILTQSAFAQEAAASGAGTQNPLMSFVPFIAIFFVFYFLMIRPQKKKFEEEQNYLNSLQKGEEIYTKSGLIGTISGLNEKVVTLELEGGHKVKFLRTSIGGSFKSLMEKKETKAATTNAATTTKKA